MKCLLIFIGIALVAIQVTWADEECVVGAQKKVACNDCHCSKGGWACTRKQCEPVELHIKRERRDAECTDQDTKQIDCNSCHCAGGKWACTRKFCVPPKTKRGV